MVVWFAIVLILTMVQVILRYCFNAPLTWSEEFARYSFVWISYLGCAYCVGVDGHTSITALKDRMPVKVQKIFTLIGNIIVVCIFIRLMPIAVKFIYNNRRFKTSMMRIPYAYLYVSLVVGSVLTTVHLILKSILLFDKGTEKMDTKG